MRIEQHPISDKPGVLHRQGVCAPQCVPHPIATVRRTHDDRAMAGSEDCPFCARVRSGDVVASSELAVVLEDAFPLNRGHTLVVPRRHAAGYFDLSDEEQVALWRLVAEVRAVIDREHRPHGYNLGVNVGEAAGQTVGHKHVHVIPRYAGDVDDPRGGVRWVVPARATYWDTEQ